MDLTDIIALLGMIAGGAYLVLSYIAFRQHRARRRLQPAEAPRVLLEMEDGIGLVEGEATDDRMHKLAAICATTGRKVFAEDFDYSVESIHRLDRAIVRGWGESNAEVTDDVLMTFGAYVGEVLVRRTRGRWVTGMTDNDPANVLFLSPGDEAVSVSPFLLVREKFENIYGFDLSIAFTALEQKLKELNAV